MEKGQHCPNLAALPVETGLPLVFLAGRGYCSPARIRPDL